MNQDPAIPTAEAPPAIEAPWQDIVLTCAKCTRKLKGGFGRKRRYSLRDILKQGLRDAGLRRNLRVVEVGCLGLCPRDAVTLVRASHPRELRRIPAGSAFSDVLPVILPEPNPAPG